MHTPVGGHTAIDALRTMSARDFPPPEELLGPVDYIMVPRSPSQRGTTEFLLRTYGDYLKDNFDQTKESEYWVLWTRHK